MPSQHLLRTPAYSHHVSNTSSCPREHFKFSVSPAPSVHCLWLPLKVKQIHPQMDGFGDQTPPCPTPQPRCLDPSQGKHPFSTSTLFPSSPNSQQRSWQSLEGTVSKEDLSTGKWAHHYFCHGRTCGKCLWWLPSGVSLRDDERVKTHVPPSESMPSPPCSQPMGLPGRDLSYRDDVPENMKNGDKGMESFHVQISTGILVIGYTGDNLDRIARFLLRRNLEEKQPTCQLCKGLL